MIAGLGPRGWADLAVALAELARARFALRRRPARDLLAQGQARPVAPRHDPALVARVAYAVPRVAARLPWRADCWVQALAAQRWLHRHGVATDLFIGVRRDRAPGFEAHAWLRCGHATVTGGDFSGFVPLVTPATPMGPAR
ncbi:MAG: lasso peptide biosynthesis B2 protein [Rhodobacterales bacterium]|nr:lasso peptide biosynthesis B2 protein [Rhodobacterales bacterium]NCT12312.1 lasso peptide biosynthesis B2 protein [Rhodobacterales bacterium]